MCFQGESTTVTIKNGRVVEKDMVKWPDPEKETTIEYEHNGVNPIIKWEPTCVYKGGYVHIL